LGFEACPPPLALVIGELWRGLAVARPFVARGGGELGI
jgi:hypothetical protein